jgi:phosphoribosylformylglycinamidine synthase
VYAEYVHLLSLRAELTEVERGVAAALLEYGPRHGLPSRVGERQVTVLPRAGTISPWSSKATDIFGICGLDAVRRVERGVVWFVEGGAPLEEIVALQAFHPCRVYPCCVDASPAAPSPHAGWP